MSNINQNGKLSRKALREHEERILLALAGFYYEHGYKYDAYIDPETGGIYEHKFADRMGYKLIAGDKPPPEFTTATMMLEAQGYVRRIQRRADFPIMGVWPTLKGLDHAEYLRLPWYGKVLHRIQENWSQILVSFVTTLVTLALSSLFGLFGLGEKNTKAQPASLVESAVAEKPSAHNKPSEPTR